MKLSFIAGYGAGMLPVLSKILAEEAKKLNFDYLAVSDHLSEKHAEEISKSDAIFLYASELPEKVEKAIEKSKAKIVISASENFIHLSRGSMDVLNRAIAYFKTGGEDNLRNLIRFILKSIGMDVKVEDVSEVPWHGIYHPELGIFKTCKEYLRTYDSTYDNRPLVGILIHRNYWLYGNLKHFDAVVKALEDEGLGVLPVFTHGLRDEILNTPSKEDTIREFFIDNGKAVVDAVLNLTYFFILDHGKHTKRFREVEGIELLKKLNVPIIQPCFSSSQSVNDWHENPQGLDYLSQVYTIIMPEVDGLIEPVYLAGSKLSDDGIKTFEPYREHARYLARRIKKWTELRKKKAEERKIAIVLINPPCKELEASIGVGFGLDVPESIARLLKKLKEEGYSIENLPENGNELIRLILGRKAISEFRWTSVEEIVDKGGAVDFVDLDTYLEWFNELPEKAREELVKEWGKPEDVLSGKLEKELVGMVYNNKFVIPGILFGNIFITPQPKFGCAGSRCDGKVCRILHNPTIPPPHQWLAVYRWITRVFKADILIHFGTHGYLEFRPGKSIGLSNACWPEISIDDVPHCYVYNVSNPMEGVIAKRRSYSTIVDHVYPPMAMAEVLEDIDALLAQYSKAKQLGDFERAELVYEDLIEKAEANNIPIRKREPEKVVEDMHRYVDAVRGTQIELGLHVFAHPRIDKLAEHVATVMTYDSNEYPSIRRVLAEYIGLNYDELRAKPQEVNKLGLTNSETLNLLHNIAVSVIQELLDAGEVEHVFDLIDKNISRFLEGLHA
jgi:cobaltochelatase CobN